MPRQPLPIHSCTDDPLPEEGALLRLYLPDGTTQPGVWIAGEWRAYGRQVFPERWQLLPRVGMILHEHESPASCLPRLQ